MREGKDGKIYCRNGVFNAGTKEEITSNWFRIRGDFDAGRFEDNHEADVGWLLDYIDILNNLVIDLRKGIQKYDEGAADLWNSLLEYGTPGKDGETPSEALLRIFGPGHRRICKDCVSQACDCFDRSPPFDFKQWIQTHIEWSTEAFGPSEKRGPLGPLDHLKKELKELLKASKKDPTSDEALEESVDMQHLLVDFVWRAGRTIEEFFRMMAYKQKKNMAREWPDWRTAPKDKAIEHVRGEDELSPEDGPDYEETPRVFCEEPHPRGFQESVSPCDRVPGHTGDHRGRIESEGDPYGSDNVYWRNDAAGR